MKPQEAIGIMKIAISEVEWEYPMDYPVAFEEAIKALEKQIPEIPDYEGDGFLVYDTWICPSCGRYYELDCSDDYIYCPQCGQRIDWSTLER